MIFRSLIADFDVERSLQAASLNAVAKAPKVAKV